MTRRGRQRGFTLIEVVVAFAILAMSLGALYESFGGSLKRSTSSSRRELAALRAESLLAEFRGSGGLLPAQHRGADSGFEWQITSKPYPAELAEQSAWTAERVTVEVRWGASAARSLRVESVELVRRATT
jgi:general secretion pathway protein I